MITSQPWRKQDLTYCSNVHPAETEQALAQVITLFINGVRQARALESMGSGLWLTAKLANELTANSKKLIDFQNLLHKNHIRLFTLNGFPFGDFHAESVKERVYSPDWSEPERLQYTLNLAQILATCLPDDVFEGTISTLPLGYKLSWNGERHQAALKNLVNLAQSLAELKQSSGRSIRICLEMEPDCVLETTSEIIRFFQQELPAQAHSMGVDSSLINSHLGICYDVCHQAVMFEDIADSLNRLLKAGIVIGKIQISSALELHKPNTSANKELLRQFAEPKYLHQVRTQQDGKVLGVTDLINAFDTNNFPDTQPWRVHFHVPIQSTSLAQQELGTTQAAILEVLDFLTATPSCRPHLEVETYTWQVLPAALRPQNDQALIAGLTAELAWLERAMSDRNLLV